MSYTSDQHSCNNQLLANEKIKGWGKQIRKEEIQLTLAMKRWSTLDSSLSHQSWPACWCKPHTWYLVLLLNTTDRFRVLKQTEYERTIHPDLGWCSGRLSLSSSMLSRSSNISSHTTVWLSRSTWVGIVTGLQLMPTANYLHHDGVIGSIASKTKLFQLKWWKCIKNVEQFWGWSTNHLLFQIWVKVADLNISCHLQYWVFLSKYYYALSAQNAQKFSTNAIFAKNASVPPQRQ